MDATDPTISGLYAQVLGSQWNQLAEAVRQLHAPGVVYAVGTFRVRRGSNRLARFAGWLAGLPTECDMVPMKLIVTPTAASEEWRRHFGGETLTSLQRACNGLLVEQMGWTELGFQLEAIDGALHYQTRSAAIRWGILRCPLPRWWAPCVTASEKPTADGLAVCVEVSLPLLGRLITYEGTLTAIEMKPC